MKMSRIEINGQDQERVIQRKQDVSVNIKNVTCTRKLN
jgi:hypothetical protein